MVWFSYHGGHSGEFCRHAKGQLADVVEAAARCGFSTYGLTEHVPRFEARHLYPDEADLSPADLEASFRRYVASAVRLRERYADRMELLVGFESERLPTESWLDRMQALRRGGPFDYVVGSVHSVGDTWIDLNPETTEVARQSAGGELGLHCAYFDALADLVTRLRPEVVGHLDLVRRFDGYDFEFSPRALAAAERALLAAREVGAAVEVNAAPERRGFGPVYPGPQLLRRACEMGVCVTLGDDSHGPSSVGVGLDASMRAIERAGYRQLHYLTRVEGAVVLRGAAIADVRPGEPV